MVSVPPPVATRLAETERPPAAAAASPSFDAPVDKAGVASLSEPAAPPVAASVSPAVATASVAPPVATVTGCLEMSDDEQAFRLSDTDGTDAPKARSWRTGFLRKRSSPVALVTPADRSLLETNVGKRVAATGTLAGRELTVNSLRVLGPSCD